MGGLGEDDEGAVETSFRDVIMLCLMGFICVVIMLLPHLNPPGDKKDADQLLPGNISVDLYWDDDRPDDMDLWVQAPGDVPVGYSNKGGSVFNLLRDDLGNRSDNSGRNFETAYSRGVPAGEYTINVHYYRGSAPITVRVIVKIKPSDKAPMRELIVTEATLTREGEELTIVRFTLDAEANLVVGSMHNLQKNIRERATP